MVSRFKKLICLAVISVMLVPTQLVGAAQSKNSSVDTNRWELVWSDEFDGDSLDTSKWAYETGKGHNNEAQYYTENNVSVNDGTLKITAKKESKGGYNYTSGRLETITEDGEALFSTKYGRIEARIKLPKGNGLWPAFWMQPVDNEYGSWPLSGEIDIMEARGRLTGEVNGAIHFGESRPFNKQINDTYTFSSGTDITEFHVYAVEWKENEIIWYVDGVEYFRASNWYTMSDDGVIAEYPAPFNQEFYIILNLAVGGDYDNGITPSSSDLPATMEVDYVRVYHDVNGYADSGIKMPEGTRDEATLEQIPVFENNNLLKDINFDTINTSIVDCQNVDLTTHNWYFTTNKYHKGSATLSKFVQNGLTYVNVDITEPGPQVYSVQLIQQLPLAKGYIYKVKFDAMCPDGNKTIKVKAYGETNYCSSYKAKLTNSMQTFEFSFMMNDDSDLEAMLQMNLGETAGDVIIGNVSVIAINNGTNNVTNVTDNKVDNSTVVEVVKPQVSEPSDSTSNNNQTNVNTEEVVTPNNKPSVEPSIEDKPEAEDKPVVVEPETEETITEDTSDVEVVSPDSAVDSNKQENNTNSNDNNNGYSQIGSTVNRFNDYYNRFKSWLFKR